MRWFPLLLVSFMFAAGCGRTVSLTTVNPDGTWKRTVELRLSKNTMGEQAPKIADSFRLPVGAGWKSKTIDTKSEVIWRGEQTLNAGQAVTDIQILKPLNETINLDPEAPKPAPKPRTILASNSVSVRALGDGKFEYLETITWKGDLDDALLKPQPEIVTAFKSELPENMRSEKIVGEFAVGMQRAVFLAVFGPNEPILPLLLGHPGLAEEMLKERLGEATTDLLKKLSPTALNANQTRTITKAILGKIASDDFLSNREPGPETESKNNMTLINMTSRLDIPGEVIETNGKLNKATGQIYWAFYPEAAMLGPIQLRCVFTVKS